MTIISTSRFSRKKPSLPSSPLPMPTIETEDEDRYRPLQWPIVRRLLQTLAPYKNQYMLGIGLGLVHVLLDMQSPRFISRIINYGSDFAAGKLPGTTPHQGIVHILLIVAAWTGV